VVAGEAEGVGGLQTTSVHGRRKKHIPCILKFTLMENPESVRVTLFPMVDFTAPQILPQRVLGGAGYLSRRRCRGSGGSLGADWQWDATILPCLCLNHPASPSFRNALADDKQMSQGSSTQVRICFSGKPKPDQLQIEVHGCIEGCT